MLYRRRQGATIGLILIAVFVIITLGVGLYFLMKIIGGGRELANAGDAGSLNVAKQALRNPSNSLSTFSTVAQNNFSALVDQHNTLDLLVYNRLVAHSLMVALNAKAENTTAAAANAKQLYDALNEVGSSIFKGLDKSSNGMQTAKPSYEAVSNANTLRMLGGNAVQLTSYRSAYMKPTESTNVAFPANVLASLTGASLIKLSTGTPSASGAKYMQGYAPMTISMAGGQSLTFSGVPLSTHSNDHLVSEIDFAGSNLTDGFLVNSSILAGSVPPNSYECTGKTKESKSGGFLDSVAAAIAAAQGAEYTAGFERGYLIVKNGPDLGPPASFVGTDPTGTYDIFMNELGVTDGIAVHGQNPNSVFVLVQEGLWTAWYNHNTQGGPMPTAAQISESLYGTASGGKWKIPYHDKFFRLDNQPVTMNDLLNIKFLSTNCNWPDYDNPSEKPECIFALGAFKRSYQRPGYKQPLDSSVTNANGWTKLEYVKAQVQNARYDADNQGWANVTIQPGSSGMKYFDHDPDAANDYAYAAPNTVKFNFGKVESPYKYLGMIDQVASANSCGSGSTLNSIVNRCQQILPSATKADVVAVLNSQPLPLGATLYISSNGSALKMSASPPQGVVNPSETADGGSTPCNSQYTATRNEIDVTGDGHIGTDWVMDPYHECSKIDCTDSATWVPSSGFNNLLGQLSFANGCFVSGTSVTSDEGGTQWSPGEAPGTPPDGGGTGHFGRAN